MIIPTLWEQVGAVVTMHTLNQNSSFALLLLLLLLLPLDGNADAPDDMVVLLRGTGGD